MACLCVDVSGYHDESKGPVREWVMTDVVEDQRDVNVVN
jgi:hypothetical protein